ncbi:hypothetical protein D3C74_322510 [compost metagenome]
MGVPPIWMSSRNGSTSGVEFAVLVTKPVTDAKPAFVDLTTSAKSLAAGPELLGQPSQPACAASM